MWGWDARRCSRIVAALLMLVGCPKLASSSAKGLVSRLERGRDDLNGCRMSDSDLRTSSPVSAKLRFAPLAATFFFFSLTGFVGFVSPGSNTSSGSWWLASQRIERTP